MRIISLTLAFHSSVTGHYRDYHAKERSCSRDDSNFQWSRNGSSLINHQQSISSSQSLKPEDLTSCCLPSLFCLSDSSSSPFLSLSLSSLILLFGSTLSLSFKLISFRFLSYLFFKSPKAKDCTKISNPLYFSLSVLAILLHLHHKSPKCYSKNIHTNSVYLH